MISDALPGKNTHEMSSQTTSTAEKSPASAKRAKILSTVSAREINTGSASQRDSHLTEGLWDSSVGGRLGSCFDCVSVMV